MSQTLDLDEVKKFTDNLANNLARCDGDEGTECMTLDATISFYGEQCNALWQYTRNWADAVFRGDIEFDPAAESILKSQIQNILDRASDLVDQGDVMEGPCFEFENLSYLTHFIVHFERLLDRWESPKKSVSPAPRVRIPVSLQEKMKLRLAKLQNS